MNSADLTPLTARVVAAYVAHNAVPVAELPRFIASVHGAFDTLGAPPAPAPEPLKPAVPIAKSVTDEAIICLEDGKRFQSLKKHLAKLGMTPQDYRTKWGLAKDYPMVAPNYAAKRSALAKSMGLGGRVRTP